MSDSLPVDCSPRGSSVYGILQARTLECVAKPSCRGSPRPRNRTCLFPLLHWQVGVFCFFFLTTSATWEAYIYIVYVYIYYNTIYIFYSICYVVYTIYIYQRRQWQPTPVLLPGKSHGRRSLVGCSPWGCKESDTPERFHFHALEKEMATHSSILAWRVPETGDPGWLPSMGSHRVRHD